MSFEEIGVCGPLIKALKKEKIIKPLPVQEQTFVLISEGKQIAVQSETGSGKTLAYVLPLMQRLLNGESGNKILILVPTHELALQVTRQVNALSQSMKAGIAAVPVVGNVNIRRQVESLKEKPQIVVGTCGRILELIQKRKITAHLIQTIVVDEADKMLEKTQIEETGAVIKKCMRDVQKLFFSASLPQNTLNIIKEIAPDIQTIQTKDTISIPKDIEHLYVVCEARKKMQVLRSVISAVDSKKTMVFINRAYDIDTATSRLKHHSYSADCLHGSERKEVRKHVVENFRKGNIRILVGTDIAARGLHFDDVDVVVQYSIPEDTKNYLHRAGRCGRNGRKGTSISIVTEKELPLLWACRKAFGIQMQECVLKNGRLVSVHEKFPQREKIKKKPKNTDRWKGKHPQKHPDKKVKPKNKSIKKGNKKQNQK